MSEHIGTINLEETFTVTWPIASGYTNGIRPDTPSDKVMNDFGVHFYRLGSGNFNEDNQINTDVIDRLANFNVVVILNLRNAWNLWKKRNNKADDYYVWEHLDDFKEAIDQAVSRIQPHITNKRKFWVSVWNEPDWWLDGGFWKGNLQDFKNTWRTAYNKLRSILLSEQKIIGPGISGYYKSHLKNILAWMDNENLFPDHISYHYPSEKAQEQSYAIQSWGYEPSVYIGEYLTPTVDHDEGGNPIRSYGYPGKFVHQIAAFTYGRITGGGLDPIGKWNIGGLKGMNGLIAERGTDKLTNLGYVCKLYTEVTSINNRPVASVLDVTDAGNTKIFATKRYDKTHILLGTYKEVPVITQLELNNAENYYHKVTLWIIPNATKNDPFDESDLIKGYSKTKLPDGNTLTIDVTDWSERESAKYDACYIEVKKVIPPLSVYIDGPSVVSNPYGNCTAEPSGGVPPYGYSWKIRRHTRGGAWGPFSSIAGGKSIPFRFGNNIDEVQLVAEVTDSNNETADGTLYVRYDQSK